MNSISIPSLICAILLAFFPLSISYAQNLSNIFEPSVEINLTPGNPGPHTRVTATLSTNSFDLNASFIAWAINGRVIEQGIGKKSVTFTTRDSSQIITLQAAIQTAGSKEAINREVTIIPGELDVIWEVQGYTPPFYEGKARGTLQSQIIFTAIPQIATQDGVIPANDLIYTWHKNNEPMQGQSGYGKHVVIVNQDFLSRPFTMRVVAETRDGSIVLEDSVSVGQARPVLVLYEEDPLLGLRLEKGITGSFSLEKEELWLRAVPYFADSNDRVNGFVNAEWRMNGQIIQEGPLEERVVLRRPEESTRGRVNISLSLDNENRILQSLQESFSILIEPLANNSVF